MFSFTITYPASTESQWPTAAVILAFIAGILHLVGFFANDGPRCNFLAGGRPDQESVQHNEEAPEAGQHGDRRKGPPRGA